MASFSKVLTVTSASYSPLASPSVVIDSIIQPKRLVVQNVDAADRVFVSFDGVNDHAMLLDNALSPMCLQQWSWQIAQKVWLRTATGTATEVQVVAEG